MLQAEHEQTMTLHPRFDSLHHQRQLLLDVLQHMSHQSPHHHHCLPAFLLTGFVKHTLQTQRRNHESRLKQTSEALVMVKMMMMTLKLRHLNRLTMNALLEAESQQIRKHTMHARKR
jgi:hypothetical protein